MYPQLENLEGAIMYDISQLEKITYEKNEIKSNYRGSHNLIILHYKKEKEYHHHLSSEKNFAGDLEFYKKCDLFEIKRIYKGIDKKFAEKIGEDIQPRQINYPMHQYNYLKEELEEKIEILEMLDNEIILI